jgi:hypothetical protein
MIEMRRMKQVQHNEFLRGRKHLEHPGTDGRPDLKLIFNKEEDACPLELFGSR